MLYPPRWEDQVFPSDTGFPQSICISRNAGGSLFVRNDQPQYFSSPRVLFSLEKFKAYQIPELKIEGIKGVYGHAYQRHNVGFYPGAVFLRNWAILTLNEVMKQLGEKLLEN